MGKRRIGVRAIIIKDNKILLAMLTKAHKETDTWITPGGGLDDAESLEAGLHREIVEETGIAPKIGRLLLVQQIKSDRGDFDEELEFFFHVENADDYDKIDLKKASHGFEHSRIEFVDPTNEPTLPTILGAPEFQSALTDPQANVLFHNELG